MAIVSEIVSSMILLAVCAIILAHAWKNIRDILKK